MLPVTDGCPAEVTINDRSSGRAWTVEVLPFELGDTAVTVGLWADLSGESIDESRLRLPKTEVSWRDAVQFCNALSLRHGLEPAYEVRTVAVQIERSGRPHDRPAPDDWDVRWNHDADGYRLPTEAEWLYACRSGTSGPRYGPLDAIAWYAANSGGRVQPVAVKQPSPWGLHDMLGGVWEWCWELYDVSTYGPYRVIRGGGWADEPWSCRAGVRRKTQPTAQLDDLGFRLARSPHKPVPGAAR